jgi:hypothetical protein
MNAEKMLDILTLEQAAAILIRDEPNDASRNVAHWLRNRAQRMKTGGTVNGCTICGAFEHDDETTCSNAQKERDEQDNPPA